MELGNLAFNHNTICAGASGAIFGLLGALLYFGYYYRTYLGSTLTRSIVPVIIINLLIGLFNTGIDNAAHIGGLVGGILLTMAVGVPDKSNKNNNSSSVNNQSSQDNDDGGNQVISKSQEKITNNMLVLGSNIYKSPQSNCIHQEKTEQNL